MKLNSIIKVLVMVLITVGLTLPANADDLKDNRTAKKSVTLTIDKPIIDFLAKIYGSEMQLDDVFRVQRFLSEIDHITITFKDEDDMDYILIFKELNDLQLEEWMFDEGYLNEEPQSAQLEAWMMDPGYLM